MDNKEKKPLVVLTGPTAVGKTALSIGLAKAINGEMISADSMQVYKRMDIGTAKIKPEEMQGIPHYLIDILEPTEDFNVVLFQKLAKEAMNEIYEKGKIPIIVGGTGFYIQALLYDIDFNENDDDNNSHLQSKWQSFYEENGAHELHEQLKEIDPVSYDTIHENNVKRVIRALCFYEENNQPISEHNEEQRQKESPYNFEYFVLNDDRDLLYQRIEQRIDEMADEGLIEEVKALVDSGCHKDLVSMQGLGYKEFFPYFQGECSLEDSLYVLKRDTRHFAKRQLTWFRREKVVHWIDKREFADTDSILEYMVNCLKEKAIID